MAAESAYVSAGNMVNVLFGYLRNPAVTERVRFGAPGGEREADQDARTALDLAPSRRASAACGLPHTPVRVIHTQVTGASE